MDNKNAAAFGAADLGTVILYQAVVNVETGITFITGNNHFVPLYFLYQSQCFFELEIFGCGAVGAVTGNTQQKVKYIICL
jgi:hypothetical protein